MDRSFYKIYFVLHPPVFDHVYRDPYMRQMYGGESRLPGYKESVKYYDNISAFELKITPV